MKKIYLAALTLAMTACVSNDDLNPVDNYGYIDVNVSNDPVMVTRADQTVSGTDLSSWTITANGETDYNLGETTKVKAGTYSITASSHTSLEAALDGWGNAYYTGTVNNIQVNAGETAEPVIQCGKAQNARIQVTFNFTTEKITDYSLTLDPSAQENDGKRNLTYNNSNSGRLAYFAAEAVIPYTLKYKYSGGSEQTINKSITLGEAATESIISVSSNDNGTITLSVTFNDEFDKGTNHEFTFDAATGTVEKQPADANS